MEGPIAHPADAQIVRAELEREHMRRRVASAVQRPWRVVMTGRDPLEAHRGATPLELFFDLVFVVAVAQAAAQLHHTIADGTIGPGLVGYLLVLFAIWWPWVNFTWFASAFDTDDVPYRLLTFVQMTGVLVVAAGIPRIFEALDFSIAVVGYVLMRVALVAQWLRVARQDPRYRPAARRFAIGITAVQAGWVARLVLDGPFGGGVFALLLLIELLIPAWAERAGEQTPWHPEHIAERYGLFTIIVLGEGVLATTTAVQASLEAAGLTLPLVGVAGGGLLTLFSCWWLYFKLPTDIGHHLALRWQLGWSYLHFVVFASLAALGAGLQVAVEAVVDPEHVSPVLGGLSVALPIVLFLGSVAVLHQPRSAGRQLLLVAPSAAALLVVAAAGAVIVGVPAAILATGAVVAGVAAVHIAATHRRPVEVAA